MNEASEEVRPAEVHRYKSYKKVPADIKRLVVVFVDCSCSGTEKKLTMFFFSSCLLRYWAQRYKIFSRYDSGIWLTDDAWFGVTPEPVAKFVTGSKFAVILNRTSFLY